MSEIRVGHRYAETQAPRGRRGGGEERERVAGWPFVAQPDLVQSRLFRGPDSFDDPWTGRVGEKPHARPHVHGLLELDGLVEELVGENI